MFCAYDRKSGDDDSDGCNDNYDRNNRNFEENDEKKLPKNNQLLLLLSKNGPIIGTITC